MSEWVNFVEWKLLSEIFWWNFSREIFKWNYLRIFFQVIFFEWNFPSDIFWVKFACWSSLVPHSCSSRFPSGKYWPMQTLGLRPLVCIGQYLPSGNPSEQLCGTRKDQQADIDLKPCSVNVRIRLGSCPLGLYSIVYPEFCPHTDSIKLVRTIVIMSGKLPREYTL